MSNNNPPIPDINRLFLGAASDFEVETVFGQDGCISPDEAHEYDELLLLLEGTIDLQLGEERKVHKGLELIEIPAGTRHIIRMLETPTNIVIIHPDRNNKKK
jgi:quercetin dioxygenase-like cupin family protein